jgi:hypothetical protein
MKASKFRLRSHMILEGDVDGEGLILIDGHSGAMCACNASAALLLVRLRQGARCDELTADLCQRYGLEADAARRDARDFLDRLSALAGIEILDACAEPRSAADPGLVAAHSAA